MRRAPIALLFALAALAILAYPSTTNAITRHVDIPHGVTTNVTKTKTVWMIPSDTDLDGVADRDDNCPQTAGESAYGGCKPPAPAATSLPTTSAPAPTATTTVTGCPASLAGESSSPTAINPTSGAAGCIQALPSTWAAYGDPAYASAADAPVSVQMEALARICAAQGNDAWVAADPC